MTLHESLDTIVIYHEGVSVLDNKLFGAFAVKQIQINQMNDGLIIKNIISSLILMETFMKGGILEFEVLT